MHKFNYIFKNGWSEKTPLIQHFSTFANNQRMGWISNLKLIFGLSEIYRVQIEHSGCHEVHRDVKTSTLFEESGEPEERITNCGGYRRPWNQGKLHLRLQFLLILIHDIVICLHIHQLTIVALHCWEEWRAAVCLHTFAHRVAVFTEFGFVFVALFKTGAVFWFVSYNLLLIQIIISKLTLIMA